MKAEQLCGLHVNFFYSWNYYCPIRKKNKRARINPTQNTIRIPSGSGYNTEQATNTEEVACYKISGRGFLYDWLVCNLLGGATLEDQYRLCQWGQTTPVASVFILMQQFPLSYKQASVCPPCCVVWTPVFPLCLPTSDLTTGCLDPQSPLFFPPPHLITNSNLTFKRLLICHGEKDRVLQRNSGWKGKFLYTFSSVVNNPKEYSRM